MILESFDKITGVIEFDKVSKDNEVDEVCQEFDEVNKIGKVYIDYKVNDAKWSTRSTRPTR